MTREDKLLNIIKEKNFVTVNKLCKLLFISQATIRRDLTKLEQQGLIRRTHGGAIYVQKSSIETPITLKNKENIEQKRYIADLALAFIEDGQTLFIEASSSCLYLAKRLNEKKGLTILTNGITTANILVEETNAEVYCTGGRLLPKHLSICGLQSCDFISHYHADLFFASCRGLDPDMGATDVSEADSMVKKQFCRNAEKTILLVDSSKFNKKFFNQTFTLEDINIAISDQPFPNSLKNPLEKENVEIHY